MQFNFQIDGPGGGSCFVEYTTDYQVWTPLTNCVMSSEGVPISDNIGSDRYRFYRATSQNGYLATQVGYIKKIIPVGFSMIANQLEAVDHTVAALLPNAPEGLQIYKWDEGRQSWTANAFNFGAWEDPSMCLNPGEGIIVQNRSGAPFEVSFVGEVNMAVQNRVPLQQSIRSSGVPLAGPLSSTLKCLPFGASCQVFRMTGTEGSYTAYTWDGATWSPSEPEIEMGEAFWSRNLLNAFLWQNVLWTW